MHYTKRAQRLLNHAKESKADPTDVFIVKSELAVAQNDLTNAEKILQDGPKELPDESELWDEISFIHFQQGSVNPALSEDALKAIELNQYNSAAYVELAFAYHRQGNQVDAFTSAQKGTPLNPKYDRFHYILGLCYIDRNMKQEALQELETFLDLYWDRPLMREYKGNAETPVEQLK